MDTPVWKCMCSSHPSPGPKPWLECVHASLHVCMCMHYLMSPTLPLPSNMQTWVTLCVCVSMSHQFWSHILIRICTCISIGVHVYLTPHVYFTSFEQLHEKLGCPCVALCVSSSPLFWSHTLVGMCTCISTCMHVHLTSMSAITPLHSHMQTWVALCVFQSWHFLSHTLIRMCTCIHACMCRWDTSDWKWETSNLRWEIPMSAWPLCIITWKHGCSYLALCVCASHCSSGPKPWLETVHVSLHVYMTH